MTLLPLNSIAKWHNLRRALRSCALCTLQSRTHVAHAIGIEGARPAYHWNRMVQLNYAITVGVHQRLHRFVKVEIASIRIGLVEVRQRRADIPEVDLENLQSVYANWLLPMHQLPQVMRSHLSQ